jgi:SulP family sulfate permease
VESVRHEHSTVNVFALGIGLLALLIIILWPKFVRNIPGSLVAIIAATVLVQLLNLPVETVGSRFGELSSALPRPGLPHIDLTTVSELIQPAITIALLAGIESLLSAVVADGMIGSTHRPNTELIAQGIANMGSAFFGGIPATGAIARTAANINNGGRTPVAGMVHAVVLLLMLVALMPLAAYIPMTALAAVLIMVAYNMSEWRTFKALLKAPKSDIAVLLITFGLTVFVDLVVAIEVGMVMAALLFMKRMSDVSSVELVHHMNDKAVDEKYRDFNAAPLPAGTGVFEINGPFFFGAADQFLKTILEQKQPYKILILRMRNVPAMDATGFHALNRIHRECLKKHITLLISNPQEQPRRTMEKAGFMEKIGPENVCVNYDAALARAAELSKKITKAG